MKLIPFDKEKHLDIMNSWLVAHGSYTLSGVETPDWGCMVLDRDQFIACGFLRRVEGGYAQIDSLATNPLATSQDRHRAQEMLGAKLVKYAKHQGIKSLLTMTVYSNTIKRAESVGFRVLPHAILVLDLRSL